MIVQKPVPFFQVVYKKHTLTLDDLLTLADQNWLNDQVIIYIYYTKNFFMEIFYWKEEQKLNGYAECNWCVCFCVSA